MGTGAPRRPLRGSHCGPPLTRLRAEADSARGELSFPPPWSGWRVWVESERLRVATWLLSCSSGQRPDRHLPRRGAKALGPECPLWGARGSREPGGRSGRVRPSARGRPCTILHGGAAYGGPKSDPPWDEDSEQGMSAEDTLSFPPGRPQAPFSGGGLAPWNPRLLTPAFSRERW